MGRLCDEGNKQHVCGLAGRGFFLSAEKAQSAGACGMFNIERQTFNGQVVGGAPDFFSGRNFRFGFGVLSVGGKHGGMRE